ncbi:hypothetical protein F5884DRAFT_768520 [Xylogone sp. PMI_703]|nr:hypothetical protein F5884DRAFT_768520 [Xylogone sp. PMI_703]
MSSALRDLSFEDAAQRIKTSVTWAWSRTTRRMRLAGGLIIFIIFCLILTETASNIPTLPKLPKVTIDYNGSKSPPPSPYNVSKVALLIENRANPILAPLMLHFISVVPPDWRFRFMGSEESVALVNASAAIRHQVDIGKLDLTFIPSNMSTAGQEMISRFLTTLWIYETVLQPAEWLLMFQTDSILCANSRQTLNNWLDYDWVGAPWNPNGQFGGNGGLSLRRVSAIIDVLKNQQREENSQPEDVWLTERLGHRPGANMANGTVSLTFSGENWSGPEEKVSKKKGSNATSKDPTKAGDLVKGIDDWRDGFYEPMGYHTGSSGKDLHTPIFGTPEMREHIWKYCPEIKMTVVMDAAKYVPGHCHDHWKRWDTGMVDVDDIPMETEWINGVEYPLLPPGLVPW